MHAPVVGCEQPPSETEEAKVPDVAEATGPVFDPAFDDLIAHFADAGLTLDNMRPGPLNNVWGATAGLHVDIDGLQINVWWYDSSTPEGREALARHDDGKFLSIRGSFGLQDASPHPSWEKILEAFMSF